MKKPIITSKASKLPTIVNAVCDVLFAIFIYSFFKNQVESLPSYLQDAYLRKAAGLIIICAIAFGVMMIYTAYQFVLSRSYVSVYEDHMEGKGIQNVYQLMDFNLTYDKITNVTCSGINIHIHTPGGSYKIVTNAQTAKWIFECYSNRG